MALAPTAKAIGAVTAALKARISTRTGGMNVMVGRPEKNAGGEKGLNLFLYEISYDPHLKNFPLDEGQKPPLWLVLKYLLMSFQGGGESDSIGAHEDLGLAMRALYQDDLLRLDGLDPEIRKPLESNPEELHVTFDEASIDFLAKLMQGSDEKLRLSIAFQVRPVMIASTEPADYSLLVGIDYTKNPPLPRVDTTKTPPEKKSEYVGLDVTPSLGAYISEITPTGFEVEDEVTLRGTDLHLSNLSVRLGTVDLPVTFQRPDELRLKIAPALVNGATISPGSQPISVIQALPTGKKRSSNMLVGNLVPTLKSVKMIAPPAGKFAAVELTGVLLGKDTDDVILAFYKDGKVVKMFDVLSSSAAQTVQTLVIEKAADAVPNGKYLMILRVNGQQAPQSPELNFVP